MTRFQRKRPFLPILWIAALAILWSVLAPSATAVASWSSGKVWIEVCTSAGTRLVAVDDEGAPADGNAHCAAPCPWCWLQTDAPTIAHAPALEVANAASERILPAQMRPRPLLATGFWPTHLSRAPPLFS